MSEYAVQENLTTLRGDLQRKGAGDLAEVVDAIALGSKAIAMKVQRARIDDVVGEFGGHGATNVQGEVQQKLDVISDEILAHCLRACPQVAIYASEEQEGPAVLSESGSYSVLADPLDGSSNIDVAVSVGTIFAIQRHTGGAPQESVLQAGRDLVAAGYVVYGSSVLMVLASEAGVDMYVLDPVLGDFVLVKEQLQIPAERKIYSINEAYVQDFEAGLQQYLDWAHGAGYGARYVGSMVADVHRTLLKGGVFIYPATGKAPKGKLRLMYEGNPMTFVIERAGGQGSTGHGPILDVQPTELHERTPVVLGSSAEVEHVTKRLA